MTYQEASNERTIEQSGRRQHVADAGVNLLRHFCRIFLGQLSIDFVQQSSEQWTEQMSRYHAVILHTLSANHYRLSS